MHFAKFEHLSFVKSSRRSNRVQLAGRLPVFPRLAERFIDSITSLLMAGEGSDLRERRW